jgi:PrtD family type I secretion system ABC transporter
MLTLVAVFVLLIMMLLDMLRARVLLGAGVALDSLLGPPVLAGLLGRAVQPGQNQYLAGLRDVAVLRSFLTGSNIIALFDSPWVPIYLVLIFLFHFWLGVVALVGAALLFILGWLNEKTTRGALDEMNRASRRAGHYIDASLRNAEIIHALGMLGDLTRRWQGMNDEVIAAQADASRRGSMVSSASRFVRISIQIAALCVGALLVINQHLTAGVMMAGTLILARALAPVETAIVTWKGLVDARASYRNLHDLLEKLPDSSEALPLPAPAGALKVERVVFGLSGADRAILKGISFNLDPGESLGLIGPSAAGKSTLARVITGIWRPVTGAVRLDGADIANWPRAQLGPHIGYVPQDVELFAGTVAQNIARLAEPEADAVLAAAAHAQVHEMILRLPKGYDAEIGVGGTVLSAGQRQRIALARALYGGPRLVVLDEPNANLDTEGEEALVRALQWLREQQITTIVISHRPSLLAGVDKLLILREGQIDAFGPRAEIMARVTPRVATALEPPHLIKGG